MPMCNNRDPISGKLVLGKIYFLTEKVRKFNALINLTLLTGTELYSQ
jgi:hypothetical protein